MERNLFQTKRDGPIILSTLAYCLHILIPSSAARRLGQLGTEDRGQHKHGHQQLISLKPASINILASWNRQVYISDLTSIIEDVKPIHTRLQDITPELKCKFCRVGFLGTPQRATSCRLCKANLQVAVVKDGVVGSHEYITQDPASPSSHLSDWGIEASLLLQ